MIYSVNTHKSRPVQIMPLQGVQIQPVMMQKTDITGKPEELAVVGLALMSDGQLLPIMWDLHFSFFVMDPVKTSAVRYLNDLMSPSSASYWDALISGDYPRRDGSL